MILPPSFIKLHVLTDDVKIRFWVPLFLAWPLIILGVLLAPAAFIILGVMRKTSFRISGIMAGYYLWELFCSLRGLNIQVNEKPNDIQIAFI